MEFKEYGEKSHPSVLLVDDLSNALPEDDMTSALVKDYHIIVPIKNDMEDSAEQTADVVERYVRRRESGKLYAICCTPDGWSLIREVLARQSIRSSKVIVGTQENSESNLIVSMLKEFALEDRVLGKSGAKEEQL